MVALSKPTSTSIFNTPRPHSFVKGREKFSYRDKINGYEFIITARDKSEAKDVINKLLEIQGDNPVTSSRLSLPWGNRKRASIVANGSCSPFNALR